MISCSDLISSIRELSLFNYVVIAVLSIICYYVFARIYRYYSDLILYYLLCLLFSAISLIGVIVIFVWNIIAFGNIVLWLLLPAVYFGFKVYDEYVDLQLSLKEYPDEIDNGDQEGVENKAMNNSIIKLTESNGNSSIFQLLGFIFVDSKEYAVTLSEDQIGKEEADVSIFVVERDSDDPKSVCFNGINDENILKLVLQKFIELNPSRYSAK